MNRKRITQGLVALIVLAGGLLISRWLITHPPKAQRETIEPVPPLVRIIRARRSAERILVEAMGTVIPAKQIVLQPEVSGRVVEQSPNLVPGGLLRAGEIVLRIDPRDYEYAVQQKEAALEKARLDLMIEKSRQVIAQREWKLLEADIPLDQASQDLALRKPQQKNARAAVAAAESALEQARLQVERTTVRAPFNALVQEEFVDVGQIVTPQTRLATLIGTDRFWVRASVPVDRVQWIAFSDRDKASHAATRVVQEVSANARIELPGRLLRLLGDLDPVGRMARVLVEVRDPLGLRARKKPGFIPLMLGAYVRVQIEGRRMEGVFSIPRTAIQESDRVWVVDDNDRLQLRPIEILWRSKDTVLVRKGLEDGDRIVTSRIPSALPGMKVRIQEP